MNVFSLAVRPVNMLSLIGAVSDEVLVQEIIPRKVFVYSYMNPSGMQLFKQKLQFVPQQDHLVTIYKGTCLYLVLLLVWVGDNT